MEQLVVLYLLVEVEVVVVVGEEVVEVVGHQKEVEDHWSLVQEELEDWMKVVAQWQVPLVQHLVAQGCDYQAKMELSMVQGQHCTSNRLQHLYRWTRQLLIRHSSFNMGVNRKVNDEKWGGAGRGQL